MYTYTMVSWNSNTVGEALVGLDTRRVQEGIMLPLTPTVIDQYAKVETDIPSRKVVREHIGGNDDVQRLLGRVTTAIAREWDNDQWVENGAWVGDVYRAKGVDHVTEGDMYDMAKARLMPHPKAITDHWGPMPLYRRATGLLVPETVPPSERELERERQASIQKGKRLANKLGKSLGFPVMPTAPDLTAASAAGEGDSVYKILQLFDSIPRYQLAIGFVNSAIVEEWDDDQWKQNYDWLQDTFREAGVRPSNLQEMLLIAGKLHIGPSEFIAEKKWQTLTRYGRVVGAESKQWRRQMTPEGAMRAAIDLSITTGNRPIVDEDLRDDTDLSRGVVTSHFTNLVNLNIRLGRFPDRAEGMDRNMLLWWGATKFLPAEGRLPLPRDIDRWSLNKAGPSHQKIYAEFNHSIDTYRRQLKHATDWMNNQTYLLGYTEEGRLGLGRDLVGSAIRRNPALFHPERPVDPSELSVFYQLKERGVNMQTVTSLMVAGISFRDPEPQLTFLADQLDEAGALNSGTLRRLEPYIIGLAPPSVDMSWSDFIVQHRQRTAGLPPITET